MKIAKKLLAAVVAVMLVCSLTVCAFAAQSADTGAVKIESDWVLDEYNSIAVYVYFVDAVELQSWNLQLKYDADMFKYADKAAGADAIQVDNCKADLNTFTDESNGGVDGTIEVGGYFKATLWTAEDFLAASARGKQCVVNDEKFEATIFYLDVEDIEAFNSEDTTITIEGTMTFGEKAAEGEESKQDTRTVSDSITHDVEDEEESSSNNEEESSSKEDEDASRPITDDDDCRPGKPGHDNCKPNKPCVKPGKPGHNHPNTGDSAALAAAAGVVLLAGAAFVVSKKRK